MMAAVTASPGLVGFITINIDPVLHIGPIPIHWYGVMYALAFLAAYQFGVLPYARRRGLPKTVAEKICVWTIIFGLLGGRLYYVVQQPNLWHDYILDPINIIAFWQGGMAFFGAIFVGFITLAICAWRYGYNPWIALDGGVLFAVVGQPIGRIGNVINGDILGSPSTLPWATAYSNPAAVLQSGFSLCTPGHCIAYQPAAVYEALGTICIGLVLLVLFRRNVRAGVLAITYVALYAVSQLILFEFRKSEPPGPLGLREAQWTSIAILVIAVPLLYLVWRRTINRTREPQARRTGSRDRAGRVNVIQAPLLYSLIGFIADALTVLIIARIAVSWLGLSPWHPVVKWLRIIVDPILAPFRKILPNFSGIDFSPILAIIVIYFIAQILQNLVFGYTTDPIQAIELLVEELVVDIAIAIAIIVFVRILLAVFHADPWHPMVQMVRTMTNPLVAPFAGLQHGRSSAGLDYAAIAALVMYIVLIIVIKIVFGLLLGPI